MFVGKINVVAGGRGTDVGEALPLELYDIVTGVWKKLPSLPRFRHSAWIHDNNLCAIGGFEHSAPAQPVSKPIMFDLTEPLYVKEENGGIGAAQAQSPAEDSNSSPHSGDSSGAAKSGSILTLKLPPPSPEEKKAEPPKSQVRICQPSGCKTPPPMEDILGGKLRGRKFRMSPRVLVAMSCGPDMPASLQRMVKSLSVSNLPEESKKLIPTNRVVFGPSPGEAGESEGKKESIAQMFVNHLLRPKDWAINQMDRQFIFKKEDIIQLANECKAVVSAQPMVLRVRAPVKVFGDFHGQYQDMMRFFDLWRAPAELSQDGDIDSYDYLFLGDYVDRGANSLETICLLMALKVKYPAQIHLLRGNHEDPSINRVFGFAEECEERLEDDVDDMSSVFRTINGLFEWLPLAALIDGRILCLHGGIGSTLNMVSDIEKLRRPLEVVHEVENIQQQLLIDVLWSDPTDNDQECGIQKDLARDPNATGFIVRFGPDRVEEFVRRNDLILIIRGHECVMDGFERFAKGQLITLFSATDYCGKHKNAGAALFVQKNFEVLPKLIFPLDTSKQSNWIENDKRPQTPPGWKSNSNDESFG